jgi:uncharacterized protein
MWVNPKNIDVHQRWGKRYHIQSWKFHDQETAMRTDMFQQSLEDLNGSTADIEASALISTDGLMIASALPNGMDEDRIGAMSAALLSLGDRTARELARGALQRVLIQGERGYVIMSSAGPEAVLTVLAKPNAKLGLIFLDIKRAAETLSKLI